MMDLVKEYWGVFVAAAGGMAWLIRLEARSISNENEIKRMQEQRKEDLKRSQDSRDEMNEILKEVRSDIKSLLQRK